MDKKLSRGKILNERFTMSLWGHPEKRFGTEHLDEKSHAFRSRRKQSRGNESNRSWSNVSTRSKAARKAVSPALPVVATFSFSRFAKNWESRPIFISRCRPMLFAKLPSKMLHNAIAVAGRTSPSSHFGMARAAMDRPDRRHGAASEKLQARTIIIETRKEVGL
jgi:hypothetical protein